MDRHQTTARVSVLLPLPLTGAYDYAVPEGWSPPGPGTIVRVPLGPREVVGVVWSSNPTGPAPPRLKPLLEYLPVPPLPGPLLAFIDWVARYTLSPPGSVLRMAISVLGAFQPPPAVEVVSRSPLPPPPRLTVARARVLAALEGHPFLRPADLAVTAEVSTGVIKAMVQAGLLTRAEFGEDDVPPPLTPDWRRGGPTLSPTQSHVAAALAQSIGGGYGTTLLCGVTGSGKTEVYFEAIAACLAAGQQALILLPEIALSAQWLERFEHRFGVAPQAWHSGLSGVERRTGWRRIARGEVPVVVGARSALFLPLGRLGLIVVDEEHDAAFKQEDGVLYQARDMAVVRGRLANAPVVLASATPSLETVTNVERGRYRRLDLPDRAGGASLPEVTVIDLRRHAPARGRYLSPPLEDAVRETLAAGDQALLFVNRRGYAPLTLCRACGHRFECRQCSALLVEHRLRRKLVCHHCGYSEPEPHACPACGATDALVAWGPGVERIAEEAAFLFSGARLEVMSSDLLADAKAARALVNRMAEREVDLLIGTQMIAKGHNFPHLTLVGIVDADLGLRGGDLRAGERSFQVLQQVAGRAGRAEKPGRVLLQTTDPANPVIQALAARDLDGFLAVEAEERLAANMPPYSRLVALIVSAATPEEADRLARSLARTAPRLPDVTVLGPAPAPMALLRGRHRRRLLVRAPKDVSIQPIITDWLTRAPATGSARITVDVDPYSFL
ncbi:MAG: primosomal protein N' [Alphaproteobacteria bacterium]|nr:MAG: primosomal protein N' [Alphaproteobacteria bacterium]